MPAPHYLSVVILATDNVGEIVGGKGGPTADTSQKYGMVSRPISNAILSAGIGCRSTMTGSVARP